MNLVEVQNHLRELDGCEVMSDVLMRDYTSFKIGGPADLLIKPQSVHVLQQVLRILNEQNVPFFVLGKGSNLLVGDKGIRGAVLSLTELNHLIIDDTRMIAGAGNTLAKLAGEALNTGLTGLEFASGIPGTLGGAIIMNAGAYGGEVKDIVSQITAVTPEGEIQVVQAEDAGFGYRQSIFQQNKSIIVEVVMELTKGDPEKIRKTMNELNGRRKEKQPLEYPSAGSTFKRPEGYYAGTLIDQTGLKGYTIGGAQVSEKHAGFIINRGNAKAQDVLSLIRHIREQVKAKHGVELTPEVHLIGEFEGDE